MAGKKKRNHDKVAQLARAEHEDREAVRKVRRKQRGFTPAPTIPRSLRAHRAAGSNTGENP